MLDLDHCCFLSRLDQDCLVLEVDVGRLWDRFHRKNVDLSRMHNEVARLAAIVRALDAFRFYLPEEAAGLL